MCDQVRHRGPDGEGFHVEGNCALGMRWFDVAPDTEHKLARNEDGNVWAVCDGRLYNTARLRSELTGWGHQVAAGRDAEPLVHLYEEYGVDAWASLRGMFAAAVWDSPRRRLVLARDPFGKKPLYYAVLPEGLYFGSELRCLRVAGLPTDLDEEALRLYFRFGWIPAPFSGFRAARKLPPGSWLSYEADGTVRQGRYWKPPVRTARGAAGYSDREARVRLREAFDEAVRIRMAPDMPVGVYLSGGMDSSSVAASLALQSTRPVVTFSAGAEQEPLSDLHYAALVAKKYHTEHHEIVVRPDAVDLVTRLVRHCGEPFADASAIPTFVVSEYAARHVKVVLTGDGGDETFCGYERYLAAYRMRKLDYVPRPALRFLSWIADGLPYSARGKNLLHWLSRESPLARYLEGNFAPDLMRRQLLQPNWMLGSDEEMLQRDFAGSLVHGRADALSEVLFFEETAVLPSDLLVKVDRMSMANSVEVRSPMLDLAVVEIASSVPHRLNFQGSKGKQLLMRALGDRFPTELLTRPKKGFSIPLAEWFRGPLRGFLWDHLTSSRFRSRGFVSPAFLDHLMTEHDSRRRENHTWLWFLLVLECWLREVEQPVVT